MREAGRGGGKGRREGMHREWGVLREKGGETKGRAGRRLYVAQSSHRRRSMISTASCSGMLKTSACWTKSARQ